MHESFRMFSRLMAEFVGSNWAFFAALSSVAVWGALGPAFGYSDTWQLAINTGTTIVTFLMVFLIQNSQNRDSLTIQLKLDELLRAVQEARTDLVDLENRSDEDLLRLKQELTGLARHNPDDAPPAANGIVSRPGEVS